MVMSGNGGNLAGAGITTDSGVSRDRTLKLGAVYAFLKITAGAVGLALLLASPVTAASIETPPGVAPVTPPGAAGAPVRADADGDKIDDALAARIAAAANSDRFDVIVVFEGPNAVARGRAAAGPFKVTREFSVINGFQATLTAAQIRGLSRANGLFKISENGTVEAFDGPSNNDMGATNARLDFPVDGTGVAICVIDTGISAAHEQFDTKGLGPATFHDAIGFLANPYDDHGHGTHVAGIATGDGGGATSLAADGIGVAPGAGLFIAKVLDASGSGNDSQVIEGIEWCANQPGVDILSMSLGGGPTDGADPLSVAVNCVADPSLVTCSGSNDAKIVVIAAGNSGALWSTVGAPGVAANAITVGSVAEWSGSPGDLWQDDGLYLNTFSSRGPVVDGTGAFVRTKPDIAAPGSKVHSAFIANPSIAYYGSAPNIYATLSGTSMATPFVSGVIALMLEADPSLGVDDTPTGGLLPHQKVRNILASTAEHRGAPVPNNEYGYGVIDAYSAVAEALGISGYVPNAYPGYTILTGENVADLGNWTHEFTVTADLVGLPISGTATIDGTFVEGCLFWFEGVCLIPSNLWSPDLEVILEQQQPSGSWLQVSAGASEVTFSECPARGDCGQVGRAEVVHFIPQGEGTFRFRVFPANDESNQGVGGNFDFEISIGAPVPGTGGNITPLAGFTFVCTDLTCNFTDTSSDVDGSVVSWNWDFGDGNSSSAQNPSHTYASGSTYSVTLTVTDDELATANVTKTVVAPPPANIPPVANFGFSTSDLTANFTDTSSDSDGTIASWSWTFGDGGTSSAANPSHAYAAAGTYDVTLIVTDDDGAPSTGVTKSVTVTDPVPNVPPVASFDVDVVDPNPCGTDFFPNTCQFTDTSTDSDGNVVSLNWDFDGGSVVGGLPIGPGESLLVQFPATGPNPVTVRLTVTDDDGATHFAERTLPISHPAPPPASVRIADLDDMSVLASRGRWDAAVSVLVHDDHGTAISGATVNGAWSNGTSGTGSCDTDANGQCMITKPSLKGNVSLVTFSVTSIVSTGLEYTGTANSDLDGDSDGTAINLAQPGTSTSQPPVASFTVDQNPCGTDFFPNTCLFTDTSTDADGDIVSWSWDFGDGQPVVAQGPHLVQFPDDGPNPVTVTLTVTDGTGATDTASLTLPISHPAAPPPVVFVHITDLDDVSASAPRNRWDAAVEVTVADGAGTPVAGALVDGTWSNGTTGGGSCTTDASGLCTITKPNLKGGSGATFTVTGVSGTNLDYPDLANPNSDVDGDSDGTTINVLKP